MLCLENAADKLLSAADTTEKNIWTARQIFTGDTSAKYNKTRLLKKDERLVSLRKTTKSWVWKDRADAFYALKRVLKSKLLVASQ
jgi:hypothetical protein